MHPIDPHQDKTPSGTETYTTSYDASFPMLTKTDHDHHEWRTNGICYLTQQEQTDKICNQNLEVLKKKMDYTSETPLQQYGTPIERNTNAGTKHSIFPPICQKTSLHKVDTIEHCTTYWPTDLTIAAARKLVTNLLKNLQCLESTLREMTQSTIERLETLKPSSNLSLCATPIISHPRIRTATNPQHSKTRNPNILNQTPFTSTYMQYHYALSCILPKLYLQHSALMQQNPIHNIWQEATPLPAMHF